MTKYRNIGRISAFFIGCLLSFQSFGAVTMLFRGDFETGLLKNRTNIAVDNFWAGGSPLPSGSPLSCIASSGGASNKIITSPAIGSFANSQTLFWECDYRQLNGATPASPIVGKQKPRNALSIPDANTQFFMKAPNTYWYTFSFYLPTDWVTDKAFREINLFQLHKLAVGATPSRAAPAKLWVTETQDTLTFGASDVDGSTAEGPAATRFTWPATKGEWHTIMVHEKLCAGTAPGADSCGFTKVYISNAARRLANTHKTAVWTDVGVNVQHANFWNRMTVNAYKYSWHCKSPDNDIKTEAMYNACMAEPPPSGTLTYDGAKGKAEPITVYFDQVNVATAADSDDIDAAIPVIAPTFNAGSTPEITPQVTRVNGDQPLDVSDYSYFTGNGVDFRGVSKVDISDGANTENATGQTSNLNGGCFTLGALSTLSGGPVTLGFEYDTPDYDSEAGAPTYTSALADWVAFTATITPITGTDPCYNRGGAVKVSNNAGTSLIDMETVDELDGIVDNDTLTARVQIEPTATNTTNNYRVRLQCDSGQLQATGALGAMTLTTTTLGDGHELTQTQDRGFTFITLRASATGADNNCQIKVGANESGTKDFNLYHAALTKNESLTRVTFNTTLNKADTASPLFSEADISAITTSSVSLQYAVSEPATVYAVVTSSATFPDVAEVKAGQNDTGAAALSAVSQIVASGAGSFTVLGLNPYVDKYVYFVATDAAGNDSAVVAGDTHITGEPLQVKTLVLGTEQSPIKRGSAVLPNTTFDTVVVWSGNPVIGPTKTILAEFQNVTVNAGIKSLTEADLKAGSPSLNALEPGFYWVTTTRINPASGKLAITNSQKEVVLQ